jgi:hypothetical protein
MKERTLQGPVKGKRLLIGHTDHDVYVTLWATPNILILARNSLPYPLIKQWDELYRVGGLYWREVPHNFTNNPTQLVLYKDTWRSNITWIIRWALIPGSNLWSRLRRHRDGNR